ncbi:hypothetical protein NliqN6_3258 [Naganishia liquefaciens]|uniref:MHD domain-containing protein n=1 Tax=Naganishia liquefaciens TaxID=104408 RepID=A0A8H3TTW3_9TREE|nr:hypothetical protein NliqN6_3258 [Naganishia liquefaciens]
MDGLIILDSQGKPIITSHFRAHPHAYPLIHIDAYNHARARRKPSYHHHHLHAAATHIAPAVGAGCAQTTRDEMEPVLWVNVPVGGSTRRVRRGKQIGEGYGGGSSGSEEESEAGSGSESESAEEEDQEGAETDAGTWRVAGLCHLEREGMSFLAPLSHEVNPLFGFAFLECFLDVLTAYFGQVTESSIRDNFDIVYMLIEEMLDEGQPMTTEPNMLKDIVLPPTLVRKLLTAAGVSGALTQTTAPLITPIPWRRPNVRYSNNEIYFDIEESMDAIVDRRGKVLSSQVWGQIKCNARLTGNPDLLLTFANPRIMDNCSFHPCVRYKKWNKDHVLSFIPPDGHFDLLRYEAVQMPIKGVGATAVERPPALPLAFKPELKLEEAGGKFSLSLTSRITARPIENIVISLYLGDNVGHVSATPSGDSRGLGTGNAGGPGAVLGCVGGGTWEFDPNKKILKWVISALTSMEKAASLVGSFVTSDGAPAIPSPAFVVDFQIGQYSFSGVRVDQLKVQGDLANKPFKGIRTFTKSGRYEVRW